MAIDFAGRRSFRKTACSKGWTQREIFASSSARITTPRAAQALLEELGLGDVGKKKVRDYSGGMQRRLALARALLAPSDALALDEPFTGLDAENREAAMRAILRAAETKIVLLSTHEELPVPVPCQIIEL